MKLVRLQIKGLFDLFDYDIPLENPENLTIITGPNGFGKTMILNIIYSLFNRKLLFFDKLSFEEINLFFEQNSFINISKKNNYSKTHIEFCLIQNEKTVESFTFPGKNLISKTPSIENYLPFLRRLDENTWRDRSNGKILELNEVIEQYYDQIPEKYFENEGVAFSKSNKNINKYIHNINVHLIKEQRLLKRTVEVHSEFARNVSVTKDTINEFANELRENIKLTVGQSFKVSQELDSTFPRRLLEEKGDLTEDDFKKRFSKLREKQEKLKKFGLSESLQEVPDSFVHENAKVLLVYLNDSEKKTGVFDDLLERLELFTNILNERRFTHKTIQIDRDKGFYFQTSKGKELSLTDLSSGEKHEVILLYELIFNSKANTIVLIDEPEISLHVTWQKEFLNDLIKIIDLQKIQVIVATHSPQIINNRWDLTVDLEKVEEK